MKTRKPGAPIKYAKFFTVTILGFGIANVTFATQGAMSGQVASVMVIGPAGGAPGNYDLGLP